MIQFGRILSILVNKLHSEVYSISASGNESLVKVNGES